MIYSSYSTIFAFPHKFSNHKTRASKQKSIVRARGSFIYDAPPWDMELIAWDCRALFNSNLHAHQTDFSISATWLCAWIVGSHAQTHAPWSTYNIKIRSPKGQIIPARSGTTHFETPQVSARVHCCKALLLRTLTRKMLYARLIYQVFPAAH